MNSPGQRHAGERVQLARAQLGLNQNELAAKAGVNPTTISFLETGKRWPRVKSQLGITRALGWPDGELERIARSYTGEPAAEDAVVAVLRRALLPGENIIRESDLDPQFASDLIVALRGEDVPDLIVSLVESRRRARRGSGS